jgi:hypothetical protein
VTGSAGKGNGRRPTCKRLPFSDYRFSPAIYVSKPFGEQSHRSRIQVRAGGEDG